VTFELVFKTAKKLILLNCVFLLLMSVYRSIFFLYYADFRALSGFYSYVLKAFFLGVRYDLAILAYINMLVTVTLLIMWAVKNVKAFVAWQKALRLYYTAMFGLVILVLICDFGFFMYFKTHINILIFGVWEDDTAALVSAIWSNYWKTITILTLLFCLLVRWVYFLTGKFKADVHESNVEIKNKPLLIPVFILSLLCLNFVAARGSFNLFPLGVMDAEISPNDFINKLSVTGLHTLQEALEFRSKENKGYDIIKQLGYEKNIPDAFALFLKKDKSLLNKENPALDLVRETPENKFLENNKPNVVVIMMEGFGADISKYNSEKFNVLGELKKHFDSDYLFMNFLSGDIGTIGSIETAVFNFPKRPNARPLTQSKYAYGDHASGGAMPFKHAGYSTFFMYGGNANWRNLLTIMPTLGFEKVEGEGSMDPSYPKNEWGVYDEYLFENIYKTLDSDRQKPKFIFVMSTTNHPPYSLPGSYKPLPLEIPKELAEKITGNLGQARDRFSTYQYSNQKLGEFITKVKNSDLGKNTIIAVTGDHNFWDVFSYTNEQLIDHFGVPFYVYVPQNYKPKTSDTSVYGSHLDMLATLYNLSLSKAKYVSLGNNLFDPSSKHIAMNVAGVIMDKESVAHYSPGSESAEYGQWDKTSKRRNIPSPVTARHSENVEYYKAALVVTEWLIKHPFKLQ
jgi:phosphoglycerol transferase MdoB-like AlkP superfamily enzyme